jgi:hypothetical protein
MSVNKEISNTLMKDTPEVPLKIKIKDNAIKSKHISDNAITTRHISNNSITYEKLDQNIYDTLMSVDINKFNDKLNLELTKIWKRMSEIVASNYLDYKVNVNVTNISRTGETTLSVTMDATDAANDFSEATIYCNDIVMGTTTNVPRYSLTFTTSSPTNELKTKGIILNNDIVKVRTINDYVPFYVGAGSSYKDVMRAEFHKPIIATLEGNHNVVIEHNGDRIYIIIPLYKENEFRRADMNGFEIPFSKTIMGDYIVYTSINTYTMGTYNIDISINSVE